MTVSVNLDDLLAAFEWVSGGESAGLDCQAFIDRTTGTIHWCGEGCDEEPPDDIEDGARYVAVPAKSEFDLGRALALRFVDEHLPAASGKVHAFFRQRGAYAQFKSLLARAGQLDAWHAHEQQAVEDALRDWCEDNGFALSPAGQEKPS